MVNAFRYGLLGTSDIPLGMAFGIILAFIGVFTLLSLWLLARGVGIKH
jgi:ABC-2 type transport system permease protein